MNSPKLCISIGKGSYDYCIKSIADYGDMAEIRLDLTELKTRELSRLFSRAPKPLIVSYREGAKIEDLHKAIKSKVAYIDIDVECSIPEDFISLIKSKEIGLILSSHNYSRTPTLLSLQDIYKRCLSLGADIVKIVATAGTEKDIHKLLSLYELKEDGCDPEKLVAFSMGDGYRHSRVMSVLLGAPIAYVATDDQHKIASGQFTVNQMGEILKSIEPKIAGTVAIPSSKSIAQRAIVFAALADGVSYLSNYSRSKDVVYAIEVAKQFGSEVTFDGRDLIVRGKGGMKFPDRKETLQGAWDEPEVIFVGESGLLSRMLIPIVAQSGERIEIIGEGTLLGRPMEGCKDIIEQLDAMLLLSCNDTLPAIVKGPLQAREITLSGSSGSQLITGLLSSLPLSKGDSKMIVVEPTSVPYIRMTYEILKKFGIAIKATFEEDKLSFEIPGNQKYTPTDLRIDGDWSSAPYFMIAGALFGDVEVSGMGNMTIVDSEGRSVQADKDVLSVLKKVGADVEKTEDGFRVSRRGYKPFNYDITHTPDLFPVLAVMALFCDGVSQISGVKRLMNKESSRAESILAEFRKLGLNAELNEHSMTIEGMSPARRVTEGRVIKGGNLSTHNDHRIAMALTVLSLGCDGEIILDDVTCVDKSFPQFVKKFKSLLI